MADEYENYTEAGIENTKPTKLEVQPYTRTDIQKIVEADFAKVAGLVKNTVESYPVWDQNLISLTDPSDLTPEADAFLTKIFEAEKVRVDITLLHLNFAVVDDENKVRRMCFGCMVRNKDTAHTYEGSHIEIKIDRVAEEIDVKYDFEV